MEIEQPPVSSAWTPTSSLDPTRSTTSGVSSNSLESCSLDTASASAHLEHYDMPWSFSETQGIHLQPGPRRCRSYAAFLDWNAMTPGGRQYRAKYARPLGGASRKRLIRQVQELTKDKANLQAQLAALVLRGTTATGATAAVAAAVAPSIGSSKTRSSKQSEGFSVFNSSSDDILEDDVDVQSQQRQSLHGASINGRILTDYSRIQTNRPSGSQAGSEHREATD